MAVLNQTFQVAAATSVVILLSFYFMIMHNCPREPTNELPVAEKMSVSKLTPQSPSGNSAPCTCPKGAISLKAYISEGKYEEVAQRRAKEMEHHKARTTSVLSTLLLAPSNSPLQYPIQGFVVRPLTPTLIPGLALNTGQGSSYKVSLNVSKGILTTENSNDGVMVTGGDKMSLTLEADSLVKLNDQLTKVSYTSTKYHIHTGDLVSFMFENHIAVFPITIKQPQLPVLYDMGTDIRSQVTIVTKTFLRYKELQKLLSSIRTFYSDINVIIADDSFPPEKVTGDNIQQYIMPPAQGWFAGRNLAVSQVTTKYFLWVDDDFLFTENTKIEKLVEVMESVPELDMVGGSVQGNQFYFSLSYEEGQDEDGGCLARKSKGMYGQLPGYPQCSLVGGVVNFFLARTDAVQRVGFDPKLKRVAHSEFFMDGLGSLHVATCSHVSIGHQRKANSGKYNHFRHPGKGDVSYKMQLHFFKNNLKCILYG